MDISLNYFLEHLQTIDDRIGFSALLDLRGYQYALDQRELVLVAIVLVIGLLFCFAGLLLIRFWSAIAGLALGYAMGYTVASFFTDSFMILVIAGAVLGIIIAFFSTWLYPVGVFIITLFIVSGFFINLLSADGIIWYLVCLLIGLAAAVVSIRYAMPVIILATAVFGAFVSGEAVQILLRFDVPVKIVVMAGLAVAGIIVQVVFENGKRKRQHIQKAKATKQEHSRINEVDAARDLLDNIESQPAPARPRAKKKAVYSKPTEIKDEPTTTSSEVIDKDEPTSIPSEIVHEEDPIATQVESSIAAEVTDATSKNKDD